MQSITTVGTLGNALLLEASSLMGTLQGMTDVTREDQGDLRNLLPTFLEELKEGQAGFDAKQTLESLQDGRSCDRRTLSSLGERFREILSKKHREAADAAAIRLGVSVFIPLPKTVPGEPPSFSGRFHPAELAILEMGQLNSRYQSALSGEPRREIVKKLLSLVEQTGSVFEEIAVGKKEFFADRSFEFFVSVWMKSFGIVDRSLAAWNPMTRREFFWKNFQLAERALPKEMMKRHLESLDPKAAEAFRGDSEGFMRRLEESGLESITPVNRQKSSG